MPFNKYVIVIYFILLLNINLFKKKKFNTSTRVCKCFMIYDKNIKLNKIEYIKKNILKKEKDVFNNILLRRNIYKKKKNILKLLYKTNSKLKTTGCQRNYKNKTCYSYLINNRRINTIECLRKVLNKINYKIVSKKFKKNNVKTYMNNSNINDNDIINLLKLNGREKNMDNSNICKSINNKNEEGRNELMSHKKNDMINNLNDDHNKIMNPFDITQLYFSRDGNSKKKEKIIIIIGVTCSGKTKFSIDLSEQLKKYKIKSEIISADSMQVYQNFNVGIAKVEEQEMRDVKHHLLDVCHPNDTFNAHKYINYTIPLIKNMNENNKIPIIAGGTLLYIESLLWESVIDIKKEEEEKKEQTHNGKIVKREDEYLDEHLQLNNDIKCNVEKNDDMVELDKYVHKTNEELYEELKNIDEERANNLHKNDRKRVCRSLDIFYTYNKKHSDLIKIKNHKNNNIDKMRFFPCIFYLDYNDDELLKMKIKNRVDLMISKGLLDEAIKLKQINSDRNLSFTTKGINQSIAYKEFDEYIKKKMNNIDDQKLFEKCKDNLIRRTYKYAKKQRRWISNRFVKVYNVELNKIDVSNNYEKQLNNAIGIVLKFLKCQ
ncbi:tRNA delta(2)-isopentenylpyrophosphate transferase, putative [Plasmodium sp. gorilla clade G3]|nr:tRNA delta(2)-isopentenylpyrophosphate transferase, putative [Plasmodium sp. gorilla clade G3]